MVCRQIYSANRNKSERLPLQTEYRISMYLLQLIVYELYALFTPDEIRIDPMHYFTMIRGGAYF